MSGCLQHLEKSWSNFEQRAIPADASLVQRTEMRRAFYSGALARVDAMVVADVGGEAILAVHREVEGFAVAVVEGRA